jgi:hypothetical protein
MIGEWAMNITMASDGGCRYVVKNKLLRNMNIFNLQQWRVLKFAHKKINNNEDGI